MFKSSDIFILDWMPDLVTNVLPTLILDKVGTNAVEDDAKRVQLQMDQTDTDERRILLGCNKHSIFV